MKREDVKGEDTSSPVTNHASRFTFALDGPALADYIRNQLEEQLRSKGELPPGIYLDTPDSLRRAAGNGEVWLDGDGLPMRLTLHVEYPQQANGEQVEADIQTDFSDFSREMLTKTDPGKSGGLAGVLRVIVALRGWASAAAEASLGLAVLGLMAGVVILRRSKKVYAALVSAIIFSMVLSPLLRDQQVYAWGQKQAVRQAESAQRQKQQDATQEFYNQVYGSNWDPHRDPLATTDRDQASGVRGQSSAPEMQSPIPNTQSAIGYPLSATEAAPDPASDDDGDGLTYLQESRLGTSPDADDSDGDQITDNAEVAGFLSSGRMWYSDPLSPDTNNDGQLDTVECPELVRPDLESLSPTGVACRDTDGDDTPDIFDRDNDGDGVPDVVDISPYDRVTRSGGAPFGGDNPLLLQVDALQSGKPAFVDFQLRPVNADHLWHALNVLDWPSSDVAGQIMRKWNNDSTFADLAGNDQPIGDNAANGDMRLTPMLEIEMTGDTIPLPLTTPAIDVAVSGEVTGTVQMKQQDADIRLDFHLETAGEYTVKIYDAGCPVSGTVPSGTALYTFEDVPDGLPRIITGEWLMGLADGEHAIAFSGSHKACAEITNIINGPYADKMIDLAALEPYGVSVQEKNDAGTLLAYVPLNMVADETGGDRVAFSGRMLYWPAADQWGDTQKVRVIWLVEMLVDHCLEAPCDDDEWVLDQSTIVHTYYDNWFLTGLAAREDHGLDIAVVYEDPTQKPSNEARQYEDNLWMLAWGLQSAFITGRDQDEDGQRDITVAEIYNRWGDPASTASDEMRWNIPVTATGVVTFAYPYQDYYIHIAMTETVRILDDVFGDYVSQGSDAPTLLFAQEAHYRTTNLSDEATVSETVNSTRKITLRLDPAQIREETRAYLSWAPYRREGDAWKSYPIKEYWDRMAVRFEEVFDEYRDDPQFEAIRRGQVFLAQSFYVGLFSGQSGLVQVGADLVGYYEASQSDLDLWGVPPELAIEGATVMAIIGTVGDGMKKIVEQTRKQSTMNDFLAYLGTVDDTGKWGAFNQRQLTKEHLKEMFGVKGVVTTVIIIVLYCVSIKLGIEPLYHTLNGVFVLQTLYDAGQLVGKLREIHKSTGSWLQAFQKEGSSAIKGLAAVGLLLGAAVSWAVWGWQMGESGMEWGSMAANFAAAHQIATTIASLVMAALAAIPIIGGILTTIIYLLDTLLYFICPLAKSENPVCKGVEGWLAEGIRWAIYSGNIMVRMNNPDRFRIKRFDQELLDPALGMRVGNSLVITTTVRSYLDLIDWADTHYSILAGMHWDQYNSDTLRSSTFRYYLGDGTGHDEKLNLYGIRGYEWDPENCEPAEIGCSYEETDRGRARFSQAGVNRSPEFYLTENYAVPAQECWGLLIWGVCYIRTERGRTNINLGKSLVFDVFPATLDEFYTLAAKDGGHALGWSLDSSPAFARLKDADGDGLRGKADGGTDPNDALWDTDADGLSDFYELQLGANPQDVDSDDDGVRDYDEIVRKTNPTRADSDGDGLTDGEEVAGWEFVYDFAAGGSQLRAWVTSDPLTMDGDEDTLTDFQEKTYGFNPRVASDPSILTFNSQVDASRSGRPDLTVRPGDALAYTATVKNELSNRYAQGLLSTRFPAAFSELAPQTFVLNPQEAVTLTGDVAVGSPPSGVYTLTQEADALITDWREISNYADMLLHLDEAAGATAFADSSGAQPPRDGACDGGAGQCPVAGEVGRYGYALRFDGADDVVTVEQANSDNPQVLTLAAWVKPDALPAQVMRFVSLGGEKAVLGYDGSAAGGPGQLHFYMKIGGSVRHLRANNVLTAGEWQFVVGAYDGSVMRLYRNGVEVRSLAVSGKVSGSDGLRLGSAAASEAFVGLMDEVALYPRTLSSQEIAALYNRPIFHMPFDEGSGATCFADDSGFRNDATCAGTRCPAAGEPGAIGGAVRFDGGDYVATPSSGVLNLSGADFTLSAWVYPEGNPPLSACPFLAEYFAGTDFYYPRERKCEDWPLYRKVYSANNDSQRWTGTFDFAEGAYNFGAFVDEGYRIYLDADTVIDHWNALGYSDSQFTWYIQAGLHTLRVEHRQTNFGLGPYYQNVRIQISPSPLPHAQAILGAGDYPTLQHTGNRLSLALNDATRFTTPGDVLTPNAWNHVAATFDGTTIHLYVDGSQVSEVAAPGQSAEAGQRFDIGRLAAPVQLKLRTINVVDADRDGNGENGLEYRLRYREGGGAWQEVWAGDGLLIHETASINITRTFGSDVTLWMIESDQDECPGVIWPCGSEDSQDDDMGTVVIPAMSASPYESVSHFESRWGDKVDLLWYATTAAAPFQGKVDEVAIYPHALAASEVSNLYETGATILRLPLDDPPGATTFADILGQHNGACAGAACPTAGVPGRQELALLFDGTDDTVELNDAGTGDMQKLTVAAWVRLDSLPLAPAVMRLVTVGDDKAVLRYYSNDLDFSLKTADGSTQGLQAGAVLQTDTWYHLAGTYDGQAMRLYLNGTEAATRTLTDTLAAGQTVRLSSAAEALRGALDEVAIYRRALSAAQVQTLYQAAPELLLLLDETQGGTTFEDATGNGHGGACSGNRCPVAGAKGQIGLAAEFDGANDYIEIPHSSRLNPEGELTLAAWVRPTNTSLNQKLVGKSSGGNGYVLGIQDGKLSAEVWDTSGAHYAAQWGAIVAGAWTHLALTWESGGDLVGYVNGNEVGRIPASANGIKPNTNPLRVGIAPANATSNPANGRLDQVTLFTRALTSAEVRAMYRLQALWVEERQSVEVTVDADMPSSALVSDETYRPNRDAVLLVTAHDLTSRVTKVELGVSTDGGGSYAWEDAPTCQDAQANAAWCPTFEPTVDEGRYLLQTRATDKLDQRETPGQTTTFLVDDTPPQPGTAIAGGQILRPQRAPDSETTWLVGLNGTVNDPTIAGSPGSGTASLLVKLTDTGAVTDTLLPQAAALAGSAWQRNYQLEAADPTGTYRLSAQAADTVGNTSAFADLVTFGVDAAPPEASLDPIPGPYSLTITSTLQLTGRITETGAISIGVAGVRVGILPAAMASMSGTVATFHFDEPLAATRFANDTAAGDATCSGSACPVAGADGAWGTALSFGGEYYSADDYLSADGVSAAFSGTGGLSFGAWVYAGYNPDNRAVLAFNTADGGLRNQIVHDSDTFKYVDGQVEIQIGHAYDRWAYVMVTIDANGYGAAYLDGVQKSTFTTSVRPDPNGRFSIGQEWDGSAPSQFFSGRIDEVAIYSRALSPAEAYGVYADAALAASGQGVLSSAWSYTLPETLDGLYQLNLRPYDVFGNSTRRGDWPVWAGEIDTRPPEVKLTIAEKKETYDVAGLHPFTIKTTYTCSARDFNLVATSAAQPAYNFQCPCDTAARGATVITDTFYYQVSPWYASVFTDTTRLYERTATCTVTGPATDNFMQACDAYGHCASLVADVDQAFEQIPSAYTLVLTPAHQAILTATGSTNIQGRAYARDRIRQVQVYDGAVLIGTPISDPTPTCTGNITTTQWTQAWFATEGNHSLTSRVIPCTGSTAPSVSNLARVDSLPPLPPTVWPLMLNRGQRLSYGRVALAGQASDAPAGTGVARVEVSVDAGTWAEASLDGSNWRYEWNLGEEPDNAHYNVAVRATDFAGWSTQASYPVTVDLDTPHPVTLTLTSDVTGGGVVRAGTTLRQIPAQLKLAWQASEPVTKLLSYQALWSVETATQTLQIPQIVPPSGPLASSYPALFDAQRIEPSVTSIFTDGNTQVDDWGPVYVDTPLTPDYIKLPVDDSRPYHGWMDSGCSAIGLDRRMAEAVPEGVNLNTPQNFYVSWDSEALRLAWTGANWDYNGDLFIYLDTLGDPTVPLTAFNPFSTTEDITLNIPGAKAFIWVQDSQFAQLGYWTGSSFQRTVLNSSQYRFDSGLRGGTTDLYIPFSLLGITNPATTPLVLYAFATDEGAMRLWTTMPPGNSLNSPSDVETSLYAAANQALQWLHVYTWPSLAPGICPSNPTGLLPLYTDRDLRVKIAADPVGASYGLLSSDLFWLADVLKSTSRPISLTETFAFMDVDNPPVGDGDTINYTLSYENRGTQTASDVTVQAVGLCGLQIDGAVNGTLTVTIGDIPPGATGSAAFSGEVDIAGQSGLCREWAAVQAVVYDNASGFMGTPLDWLWTDHRVDSEPPEELSITWPETLIAAGDNLFSGRVRDASGVPLVTMEVQAPLGGTGQTACPDNTPADGQWNCSWDATDANSGVPPADGDQFLIRLQATDSHGLTSDWTGWQAFTVDTIPPTVTFSTGTTATYSDTLVGGTRLTFTGETHDNRALGQVEVCLRPEGVQGDADCRWASVQLEGQQDDRWSRTVFNLEGQDNVAHTVSIAAVDSVGNRSQESMRFTVRSKAAMVQDRGVLERILAAAGSSSLNFHLDNVAPAITVTTAIAELEALPDRPPTTVLSGTVTDGSGVKSMYAMVRDPAGNLQSRQVSRGDGGAWWYNLPAGEAGLYAIWINAVDAADNEATFGPHYLQLTCRSADLTATLVDAQTASGAISPISLTARVRNNGSDSVPAGLPVSFYANDVLIGTALTTQALSTGQWEDLTVAWDVEAQGDAEITVAVNDDGSGAATVALCAAPVDAPQTLSILDVPLGEGWNLMSSYVNPINTDITVVQRPISGTYFVIQGYDQVGRSYYPHLPPGIQQLDAMDAMHGYWIRANEGLSPTLRVVGEKMAEDRLITLAANWNLVSYLPRTSLPVTRALAGIEGHYLTVQGFDQGALSYYPDLDPSFNTLTVMEPRLGYWIQTTETVTLQYSGTSGASAAMIVGPTPMTATSPITVSVTAPSPAERVAQLRQAERAAGVRPTNIWQDFYGPATWPTSPDAPLSADTTVTAIDPNGVVCGATVVTHVGQYGLLPCYGDDPGTPLDEGAQPGEVIRFMADGQALGEAVWTGDRARRWLPLGETTLRRLYLPLIMQSQGHGRAEAQQEPAARAP